MSLLQFASTCLYGGRKDKKAPAGTRKVSGGYPSTKADIVDRPGQSCVHRGPVADVRQAAIFIAFSASFPEVEERSTHRFMDSHWEFYDELVLAPVSNELQLHIPRKTTAATRNTQASFGRFVCSPALNHIDFVGWRFSWKFTMQGPGPKRNSA
jgi:hypothetical protein